MNIKNPLFRLLRLHSLTGFYLLVLPVLWSLSLIPYKFLSIKIIIIFILGSLIMRSVGCVINDVIDWRIDQKVERTKTRPIASGEISVKKAYLIIIIGLLLALILLLQLNNKTILIGFFSSFLVVIYPLLKKITYWPQAFLGITFNLGILMASSACLNEITVSSILLYIGSISWTLSYDTIYAHQDKEDDLKMGIKSTALLFKDSTKPFLYMNYGILCFCLLAIAMLQELKFSFYLGLIISFSYILKNITKLNINDSKNCWQQFEINTNFGLLILISLMIGKI